MQQVSKESVNYRAATGDHRCGNCVMFHSNGTCDLVMGNISAHDTCDRWEAKVNKQEDLQMLALKLPSMRLKYIELLDKAELMERADPQNANLLNAEAWNIKKDAYATMVKLFDAGYEVTPSDFGWSLEQLVAEQLRTWLCKSEETHSLESTPYQLGPHGLWHTPSHGHPKEKLPNYIEHVAHALMRDQGMDESQAIATAINAVKRWAKGDLHWGHGKVHPEVVGASQRALEEWERLKESHHDS